MEVAAPKDLSAFIKGAYRHCCYHLTVCLAPCNFHLSALLIVQRRHMLSQHHDLWQAAGVR